MSESCTASRSLLERARLHAVPVVDQGTERGGRAVFAKGADPAECRRISNTIAATPSAVLSSVGR